MRSRASEQGAVAPTSLLAAAVLAVAIGAAGYAMTSGPNDQDQNAPTAQVTTQQTPAAAPHPKPAPQHTTPPVINRANYTVMVYNNTSISGLAGRTSDKAKTFGWTLLTPTQWTQSLLSTTTVFYPPTMKAAAQQLGTDLGITTVEPATPGMQSDQLTVILTSSYTP